MIGQTIGHYRIVEKLGEGGNGVVYRAEDTNLHRQVALKFLPLGGGGEKQAARLLREARSAASLSHPNICVVHEVGEVDGLPFIAMELVEGEDLSARLERESLTLAEAVRIAAEVAEALQVAHAKGVVHRDIKPGNVMLTPDGRVKVMDFGIAQKAGATRITDSGVRMGTLAYMSPEQAVGEPAGPRTDVWSLGVMLYEFVGGELPFKGDVELTLAYSVINEDHAPLAELHPGVPSELDDLIDVMLAKHAEQRIDIAEVVARLRALQRQLEGSAAAQTETLVSKTPPRPPSLLPSQSRLRRALRRRSALRTPALAGAAAAVVLILGIVLALRSREPAAEIGTAEANLAVLPISVSGGDESLQVFSDGLMEALTRRLSQFERDNARLVVISPSEVRRQEVRSPADARAKLGANYVVEGSLQNEGDAVRLLLTLVETEGGKQVDTAIIDGSRGHSLRLQDDAVAKLANLLELGAGEAHAEELARLRPAAPGAYELYLTGRGYLQRNDRLRDVDSAIEVFKNALNIDPGYSLAHSGLCEAYWSRYQRTNEPEWVIEAKDACARALDLDERSAEAHITMGTVQRGIGENALALLSFQRALELSPRDPDALLGIAGVYEALGQAEKAEETYRQAILLRRADWNAYKQLGLFYARQSEFDKAIEQYQEVIRLTPDNAHGYTNLGVFYYRAGNHAAAEEMFKRAIEIEPRASTLSNLGTILSDQGRLREALAQYQKAIELSPRTAYLWENVGSVSRKLGDEPGARRAYEQAIRIATDSLAVQPNDASLLAERAHYFGSIGDRERARADVESALRLSSREPAVLLLLAETCAQIADAEKAASLAEQAFSEGASPSRISEDWRLNDLIRSPEYAARFAPYVAAERAAGH